ncbi:hypothetical protein CcaverHIS002_0503760 [Cutaneotrichosporon cavernicola]|uniref:NADH dehydrogenase [ubiquinone] 1 alpha subcomplex subunit n=1 Tax=Cutaneotrichosporon cavernicola TaxID=279322 RepID=A0AA48QWX4_9TREE|nr:uncharacterized protein CcaverHIS019_0504330 [Cutaneotrichosporon cavernicola]BEI84975.1 hypothetical protein CcaverHIS002_0503760 [Cutaneotrichosporon cavernicola]BEI92805.1 hypothetical protein CcaverHIS019_0504330 [Cutaneotrichosporon cavernicola]
MQDIVQPPRLNFNPGPFCTGEIDGDNDGSRVATGANPRIPGTPERCTSHLTAITRHLTVDDNDHSDNMSSLARTIRHARQVGLKEWFYQLNTIGDAKSGVFVGKDQFGNRYFQQYDAKEELPGRQRWVLYEQYDFNASQVPREWASWLTHIRMEPPTNDPVVKASEQPWQVPYFENLTGTRGRFNTYSTVKPKLEAWVPKTKPRA